MIIFLFTLMILLLSQTSADYCGTPILCPCSNWGSDLGIEIKCNQLNLTEISTFEFWVKIQTDFLLLAKNKLTPYR